MTKDEAIKLAMEMSLDEDCYVTEAFHPDHNGGVMCYRTVSVNGVAHTSLCGDFGECFDEIEPKLIEAREKEIEELTEKLERLKEVCGFDLK